MPGPVTPEDLRARATSLRSLAKTLDNSAIVDLHRRAGTDVWEGATPRRCHDDLLVIRSSILGAAGDLRRNAKMLEDRAAHLAVAGGAATG